MSERAPVNVLESEWLGERLDELPVDDLSPLLNLGSSTEEFRTVTQPHIDANVFAPHRRRGGVVHHVDAKDAPGVDFVGDLEDPEFLDQLEDLEPRSVLLSNLLEHVEDPAALCRAALGLVSSGGYVLVTGPHEYPHHPDPIDTMFRPSIEEVHQMFPGTDLIHGDIIDSGNWKQWRVTERGRPLWYELARLGTPFYRPRAWLGHVRNARYMIKNIKAFTVILQKR